MKTETLSTLPHLDYALSDGYKKLLQEALEFQRRSNTTPEHALNVYSGFIYAQGLSNYSGLALFNSKDALEEHVRQFIGFLYQETDLSTTTIYTQVDYFLKTFDYLSTVTTLPSISRIKVNQLRITIDAEACIVVYKKLTTNSQNLSVLNGWSITSKDGKEINIPLGFIHYHYGWEFTKTIHKALSNYGMTHKYTTLRSHTAALLEMMKIWPEVCQTVEELSKSLKQENAYQFFENVMLLAFAYSQAKHNNGKAFFKTWRSHVAVYMTCFIDTKVFDKPLMELLAPVWKEPISKVPNFPTGGKFKRKEKKQWLAFIPLHIKDEEVVRTIHSRLNRDINYVKYICEKKVVELEERFKKNEYLGRKGVAKPLSKRGRSDDSLALSLNDMGKNNMPNVLATFYEYGLLGRDGYSRFLGFQYQQDCVKELNLPNSNNLMFLCAALVIEHPKITYSWLYNWELFDKNGNQTGFKKADGKWIAVSWKGRRGASNAQQEIVLNEYSTRIVKLIKNITDLPRKFLKNDENDDYRYMLIKCSLRSAERIPRNNLWSPEFKQTIATESNIHGVSCADAKALAELVSLRTLRKSRGLQIYLETHRLDTVVEALGHKRVDLDLLESYLPKPLMDYFNERWVRQFQNAIMFEAMKDSKYLYDAIDILPVHLDEFLENHGLGALPDLIDSGFNDRAVNFNAVSLESTTSPEAIVLTISTGLLQVLIAIREIIESITEDIAINNIAKQWYETALFVLTTLDCESRHCSPEMHRMLNTAKVYPLDHDLLEGAIICSN
ncbi:TPA: hypothetical protein I7759_14525 [Vibrio vulnificus]|nr:hypothetical protein [Vibrio vulnificus]